MKRSTTMHNSKLQAAFIPKAIVLGTIIVAAAVGCGDGTMAPNGQGSKSPFGTAGGTGAVQPGSSNPFGTDQTNGTSTGNMVTGTGQASAPGAFGANCERNDQCQSGLCVGAENSQHYCSQPCNGSCPGGYTCVQATQDLAVCARNEDVSTGDQQTGDQKTSGQTSCSANELDGWVGCVNNCSDNDQNCYNQCASQYLGQGCFGCLQSLSQCAQASSCDPFANNNCCASQRMQCVGQ